MRLSLAQYVKRRSDAVRIIAFRRLGPLSIRRRAGLDVLSFERRQLKHELNETAFDVFLLHHKRPFSFGCDTNTRCRTSLLKDIIKGPTDNAPSPRFRSLRPRSKYLSATPVMSFYEAAGVSLRVDHDLSQYRRLAHRIGGDVAVRRLHLERHSPHEHIGIRIQRHSRSGTSRLLHAKVS